MYANFSLVSGVEDKINIKLIGANCEEKKSHEMEIDWR
jgi:hypothetical protein